MSSDLEGAFTALKRILVKLAAGRHVIQDDTTHYHLNSARFDAKGKPVFFAAVKIGTERLTQKAGGRRTPIFNTQNASGLKTAGIPTFFSRIHSKPKPKQFQTAFAD